MRFAFVFQLFAVFLLGSTATALASSGADYIWGPPESDFVRPYLEEAKLPHNARWAEDDWSPQDWIDSRGGSATAVVNGFYKAEIITDQYFDDDIPVLEVGQGFIELGAQDQRRVVAFMDEVFGVTKFSIPGVITIQFYKDDRLIGFFDANGLQLQ